MLVDLEIQMEQHLMFNHFPPVSPLMAEPCVRIVKALQHFRDEDLDPRSVELYLDGEVEEWSYAGRTIRLEAPGNTRRSLVEALHLQDFIVEPTCDG